MINVKKTLDDLRELKEIKDSAVKNMEEIIESLDLVDEVEIGKCYICINQILWIRIYKVLGTAKQLYDDTYYDCIMIEIDKRLRDIPDVTIGRSAECIMGVSEISEQDFNNILKWAKENINV